VRRTVRRIAIIENDGFSRSRLYAALTDEGYTAILFEGPGDLLGQLATAKPDLVLLNLMLGDWGDGLALAKAIRHKPGWERLPLIVMSATPSALRRHDPNLIRLRCYVLGKPFELDDLLALILGALTIVES
jgi:DNA-binding response OmpR family regulator